MELRIINDTDKPQRVRGETILPGETRAFPVARTVPTEWEIPVMDEYRPTGSGKSAKWVLKEAE